MACKQGNNEVRHDDSARGAGSVAAIGREAKVRCQEEGEKWVQASGRVSCPRNGGMAERELHQPSSKKAINLASHAPVTASLRTRKKTPSVDANRARLYMKKRANTGLLDAIS
jgi:hypothetical protein